MVGGARPRVTLSEPPRTPPRERVIAALIVFGVALVLRVLHVWQIRRAPFFDLKLGDAAAYDAWARRIVEGDWVGREVFYQAPLYPYVLALIYTFVGSSALTARFVQAILSAVSCTLVADGGSRVFGPRAGLVAGLMLATYPPAIFLDTLIQKSVLDLLCLVIVLWLVSRLLSKPTARSIWWQLGLAIGCLSLTRENAGILVLPLLVWLGVQRSTGARAGVVRGSLLLAGIAAILAPVAARNWVVGREFFLTTSQFGPNLYIGNNERSDGTYKPLRPGRQRPAYERQDATELAEQAVGRHLTAGEVSSYYTHQVVNFVRVHPGTWLRLLGRKFLLAWNSVEISDTEDQYTYAHWSWPAALGTVWHLGVLAPLAAVGIWITAKDWRRLWLLHLMLATYLASLVLFYVFARYRFPIVPFLVLFAGAGVAGAREVFGAHRVRHIVGCGAVVLAVAVFSNVPIVAVSKLEATTHYNIGVGLEARGDRGAALDEYQLAVQLDPTLGVAHNALALLLDQQGRLAEAATEFEHAIRLAPAATTHNNFAVVLGRQGRYRDAIDQLEQAVQLDPRYLEAHRNLASLLASVGRMADAAIEYRRALQLAPTDVGIYGALAAVLVQAGRVDEAIADLEQAAAIAPADPRVRGQLAKLLMRSGRLDDAAAQLRMAIQLAPDRAETHNNLGIVLAQQGQLRAAAVEFRRALALSPDDVQARRNLDRLREPRR